MALPLGTTGSLCLFGRLALRSELRQPRVEIVVRITIDLRQLRRVEWVSLFAFVGFLARGRRIARFCVRTVQDEVIVGVVFVVFIVSPIRPEFT